MISTLPYCASPCHYQRRQTRVVSIGDVPMGGTYPIRVQSMTTTDTCEPRDCQADHPDSSRPTAKSSGHRPSIRDAENLQEIKAALTRQALGPLVADIHFTPNAAMIAADYVEKCASIR
jgi:(E)-4-hydroxy-3-methylbut-2-enyl-diphosphate synthase